jgi:hypothetical protein
LLLHVEEEAAAAAAEEEEAEADPSDEPEEGKLPTTLAELWTRYTSAASIPVPPLNTLTPAKKAPAPPAPRTASAPPSSSVVGRAVCTCVRVGYVRAVLNGLQAWYERAKEQAVEEAREAYLTAAAEYFRDSPAPALFPWERSAPSRAAADAAAADSDTSSSNSRTGRRLLDAFGESLRHVNRLLEQEFGPEPRKATPPPACPFSPCVF